MIRRTAVLPAFLIGTLLALLGVVPAQAAAPAWKLTLTPDTDYFVPGPAVEHNVYTIEAENVGGTTSGLITIKDSLPPGLSATAVHFYYDDESFADSGFNTVNDLGPLCPSPLECRFSGSVKHDQRLIMQLRVTAPEGSIGPLADEAEVSGGGAAPVTSTAESQLNAEPSLGSGFHLFEALLTSTPAIEPAPSVVPFTQAGGHPNQLVTKMDFATRSLIESSTEGWGRYDGVPIADPKDIAAELPPGLIGDPQAVPRCSLADFIFQECELKDVVGTVGIRLGPSQGAFEELVPLINLQPAGQFPGELGYAPANLAFFLTVGLRSGSDYGLTITNASTPPISLNRTYVTTWGIPAAPEHDAIRGKFCKSGAKHFPQWPEIFEQLPEQAYSGCAEEPRGLGNLHGGPAGTSEVPFLTLPTSCPGQPLAFTARYDTWELPPGEEGHAGATQPAVDGCNQILFEPSIEARPTTTLADAPSGLEFNLHIPQQGLKGSPNEPVQSDLEDAVVKLPTGLALNPSSANGLGACSPEQIGLATPVGQIPAHFTEAPAGCPEQSAIGTAEVNTPLLHNPLKGTVFLATPHQNPFDSLLAAYVVLEGEGLIIKLPGRIEADPQTGQLTGKFLENPQTPFEDFHLTFFGGARGDLRTPAVCGSYETTSVLTPYSHLEGGEEATPSAEPSAEFETTEGSQGGSCPHKASSQPNAPVFRAGTESPEAGKFSPFGFRLAREDGSQEIEKIETTLPQGLTGKLAGVAECSEAQLAVAHSREHEGGGAEEKASPACPASSEVGAVQVASGAGPTPLYVQGKAYLAGPYKGAPLSLAIITPAVAGPFDLGDVVVRTALYVNQETAQIKAVSDPIPHILQGIPLDVRSITLKMARPNFTLNPTNCEEMAFAGSETSLLGNVAPLAQRFQVGGCSALPFKPKLSISLKGQTHRSGTPALKAVLTMPPGSANVASAQVTLPHSEFLDQGHLENICTRVQFSEHACPPNSVYGHAVAYTPLLDHPLEGPVYLRSSSHLLPDLAVDLEGQINVVLDSKVDSVHESLRNTFEVVPDAPVSKFVLTMEGGKHSLIENSTDICLHRQRAIGLFRGQNGKTVEVNPLLNVNCKGKGKHKKRGKKRHRGH